MASVFFSYSHKDEALRDQLESHLALLKNTTDAVSVLRAPSIRRRMPMWPTFGP